MNNQDLILAINNEVQDRDKINGGMILSRLEAVQEILIAKDIVSESEFNRYFDDHLKRNFSIK